jgi:XTP/dITP diphosphohydrolase
MNKLLIASNNVGKLKEYHSLFRDFSIEIVSPSQIGLTIEVDEIGKSYAENALIKASAFARGAGLVTLADDSGLEVDALNGLPGIFSARFSPKENANDADRRKYLLEKLRDKAHPWKAKFHCCIAIVHPAKKAQFSEGVCHGEIISKERGENGFGYDPIFFLSEKNCTMAELSMQEKNRISHRGLAFLAAKPILEELTAN